jgi:hypothetical protein
VVLAFPGVAGAAPAGTHNFEQSFPVASKLCANVAKGGGPKRLRSSAAAVLADCTVLQNNFNASRASVIATEAAIASALAADKAARQVACVGKPTTHPVQCGLARRQSKLLRHRLGRQKFVAARAYWRTLEADRAAFWAEIRALPGGKGLAPDKPIPLQND